MRYKANDLSCRFSPLCVRLEKTDWVPLNGTRRRQKQDLSALFGEDNRTRAIRFSAEVETRNARARGECRADDSAKVVAKSRCGGFVQHNDDLARPIWIQKFDEPIASDAGVKRLTVVQTGKGKTVQGNSNGTERIC